MIGLFLASCNSLKIRREVLLKGQLPLGYLLRTPGTAMALERD